MRHIVITGAGQGLGAFLAKLFLEKGDYVHAGYRSTKTDLMNLSGAILNLNTQRLDVRSEYSVIAFLETVKMKTSAIDILINNAAVNLDLDFKPLTEYDTEKMLETFDINAIGPTRMAKHFLPLLLAGKTKLLVNVSSEAGSISQCHRDREFGYCMSKAALNMLSKLEQNSGTSLGLKVLSVHPGWMLTKMGGSHAEIAPEDTARRLLSLFENAHLKSLPTFLDRTGKMLEW